MLGGESPGEIPGSARCREMRSLPGPQHCGDVTQTVWHGLESQLCTGCGRSSRQFPETHTLHCPRRSPFSRCRRQPGSVKSWRDSGSGISSMPVRPNRGSCGDLPLVVEPVQSIRLPAGRIGTGATPPRRWHASAHQPDPQCRCGRQKGGVAPVLLKIPRSARRSREASRNRHGDSRLEKSVRARRKASLVHMLPVVPCALPDRHATPLFSGQNRPPGSRLVRQIPKPAGRTTTADQRSGPDAGP